MKGLGEGNLRMQSSSTQVLPRLMENLKARAVCSERSHQAGLAQVLTLAVSPRMNVIVEQRLATRGGSISSSL